MNLRLNGASGPGGSWERVRSSYIIRIYFLLFFDLSVFIFSFCISNARTAKVHCFINKNNNFFARR